MPCENTLGRYCSNRRSIELWGDEPPPDLNAEEQRDLQTALVTQEAGDALNVPDFHCVLNQQGIKHRTGHFTHLSAGKVKKASKNLRAYFVLFDKATSTTEFCQRVYDEVSNRARDRVMITAGRKGGLAPYGKPSAADSSKRDVTLTDVTPFDVNSVGDMLNFFTSTRSIRDCTSLEALIMWFVLYQHQNFFLETLLDAVDPIPFHIEYYLIADKDIFKLI